MRRTITVGDYPVAGFDVYDTCVRKPPRIADISQVAFGTISEWKWTLDGSTTSTSQTPSFADLPPAPYYLELTVKSSIGCSSTIISKDISYQAIIGN
ncbi:MAG: hypothetical protein WDO16_07525 [Bacteroidota bacterium]